MFLPFLTLLPYKIGRFISSLRGCLYYILKRDWRSFTFDDFGIFDRTYSSYKEIYPELNSDKLLKLVKNRYINQSIEEFEAVLLDKNRFTNVEVNYMGLEKIEKHIAENPHTIFVTAHFGSSLLGITFLNRLNTPI